MTSTHVVTGATGLIGGALVLELLTRTTDRVLCPTRPAGSTPQQRMESALRAAARGYGHGDTLDTEIASRCTATPFDLSVPGCAVGADHLRAGAREFWHCAADLRFEDRHWEDLLQTNVAGTRNAVELARTLGCEVFNHFSTAYVAGRRNGLLREEATHSVDTNNRYEQSKIAGEQIVASTTGITTRILRPSIVIGHSITKHVAGGMSGPYTVQASLARLLNMLSASGRPTDLQIRVRADPTIPINLVPVDLVAVDAVSISLSGAPGGVFHLTHPRPVSVRTSFEATCSQLGHIRLRYAATGEKLTGLDRIFEHQTVFHQSYWTGAKVFDQSNLLAAVPQPALPAWSLDQAGLAEFCAWHLRHIGHSAPGTGRLSTGPSASTPRPIEPVR